MSSDPTLGHLQQLEPQTATAAAWLIWAARTAGYPLIISSSKRTAEEQRLLVRAGRSRTLRSAHLAGRAFDVDWLGVDRDAVPRSFWMILGPWAERHLGLRWGGRWTSLRDYGHFEL